ncbi:hypothetical protein ACFYUV_42385 [Nonomuraea sp. NPDC003560]
MQPQVAWPRLILDGDRPVGFLRKLGFQVTGEGSGGQKVGVLDLAVPDTN